MNMIKMINDSVSESALDMVESDLISITMVGMYGTSCNSDILGLM